MSFAFGFSVEAFLVAAHVGVEEVVPHIGGVHVFIGAAFEVELFEVGWVSKVYDILLGLF